MKNDQKPCAWSIAGTAKRFKTANQGKPIILLKEPPHVKPNDQGRISITAPPKNAAL
jgi:hypothetical protein